MSSDVAYIPTESRNRYAKRYTPFANGHSNEQAEIDSADDNLIPKHFDHDYRAKSFCPRYNVYHRPSQTYR